MDVPDPGVDAGEEGALPGVHLHPGVVLPWGDRWGSIKGPT